MKMHNCLRKKNIFNNYLLLITSVVIFVQYMIAFVIIDKVNISLVINQCDIKIIFNLILATLGISSCVVSFNSNKKQEIFMIALMYTIFSVDIFVSKITGYLINSSSDYCAILTSFIRVFIVYISVSQWNEIKEKILSQKIKSIIIAITISLLSIYLEFTYMIPYNYDVSLFYKYYSIILTILYLIIAGRYFKKCLEKNEYIYGVIGNSMVLFSIKSICDYFYVINGDKDIYIAAYSTIIFAFVVYMIGVFIELNKSSKLNKILEEKTKLFIKIIDENKHCNVIVCDENYKIQYKNKRAEQSLDNLALKNNSKFNEGQILNIEKVFENGVKTEEIDNEISKSKNFRKDVYLKSDDSILDFSVHLFEINEKIFKVIIIKDISTKYKLEKTLLEYEMVKTEELLKSEFFSNISHELRTPLNVIYSTKQLLDISVSKDSFVDTYTKYSDTLDINCKRMLRLIDNIVDMTKLDVGHKEPSFKNYDIVNVVEDMTLSVVSYANTKNIEIIFDTEIEELNVKLDLDMLERVVLNLLSNAIKFSEENSKVLVKIFYNEKWVGINVIDNGIGISPQIQHKIFDRFVQEDKSFRRKTEGSGIGLSLVKSFVELMNGEVSLESDGKSGSKFTVLLPNEIMPDIENAIQNEYNVDEERVQLEFSDIYELFNV